MTTRETFGSVQRPVMSRPSWKKEESRSPRRQVEQFSEQASFEYRKRREARLPTIIEQQAQLAGLTSVAGTIDRKRSNECKLTEEGISIQFNPKSTEELIYRRGSQVKGELPLEVADLMTIAHLVGLAKDFTDATFFIELDRPGMLEKGARKYFNACIDDTVIDHRLGQIPLFSRFLDAFGTRIRTCAAEELPLHMQFINAVCALALEADPALKLAPRVQEALEGLSLVLRTDAQAPPPQPPEPSSQGREAPAIPLARTLNTLLGQLFSYRNSYETRHSLADKHLYRPYVELLKEERRTFDFYTLSLLYADLSFFNSYATVTLGDLKKHAEFDEKDYAEEIYQITEEHADEIITQKLKEAEVSSGEDMYEVPGLILPRRDASEDSMVFAEQVITEYQAVVKRWHAIIGDTASLFLMLATPTESIMVPRYRHVSTSDGVRINTHALIDAYIQLSTNRPRPIWQPLTKELRYQELHFSGLDIFILLDVSASMGGINAEYASAMAVCLIEGLQVARFRAEGEAMQGPIDVRTQLLAFGAGWTELTPLHKAPTREQKETAYYHLMNPSSNITQVNGALKHVRQQALLMPERDVICLVVSDGLFSDSFEAFITVKQMPSNVYMGHISIGDSMGIPITPHYEKVASPQVLPKRLYLILEEYLKNVSEKT